MGIKALQEERRRKGNREAMGSIVTRKLKDGTPRYVAIYDIPPDPATGQRRQRKQVCRTKTEAKKFLETKQRELAQGIVIESSNMTVGELLRDWLQSHGHDIRPTTLADYEHRINLRIIPALGTVPLQKLTPAHVQQFIDSKRKAGVGTRTLQLCHLHLSQALKRAVSLDLVPRNVAEVVKRPTHRIRDMKAWDVDEARTFLSVAHRSTRGPIWLLALATGMRRGELLGLRWQDVDFENNTVRVQQSAVVVRGVTVLAKPKTSHPLRTIPVPSAVMAALRQHKAHQNERRLAVGSRWVDTGLVFTSDIGTVIDGNGLKNDFNALVALAGVRRCRIHDLRHAHASLMIADGVHIKALSERLGHRDVATTLNTYTHAFKEQHQEIADKVGALLFSPQQAAT